MNRADRKLWAAARTLADLGELTARWLEGRISSQPGYYGAADIEDPAMIPVLARLNRAGFVTVSSQQGSSGPGYDGAHWRQRAAVDGFADESAALRIIRAVAPVQGLVTVSFPPSTLPRRRFRCDKELPVTWRECEEYTWFGQQVPRREIRSRRVGWGACSRAARNALCSAWQVSVIDLEWGRNDLLWDVLDDALTTFKAVRDLTPGEQRRACVYTERAGGAVVYVDGITGLDMDPGEMVAVADGDPS